MLIACPSCQRQLNVPENAAGKQVRCPAPDCGTVFYVPAAPAVPQPAVPQPAVLQPAAPPPAMKPVGAPRPLAPKPVNPPAAAAPQPAGAFDFGTGGTAGPAADFGFTSQGAEGGLSGIRLRTRLGRAAGWLNMAAATMVVYTLFVIGIAVAMFVLQREVTHLVTAGCAPFLFLPFPIMIFIGARMLGRGRRRGMAMTAAILSLIVGGISLLLTLLGGGVSVFVVYQVAMHGARDLQQFLVISSCGNAVLSALVTFCSLFGGFVALRTLTNAEVKATFT
jgi:hypothetical protein